ncbi:MAG TPA: isoprenylcysteine carboxylmethyltransferase family protein [Acidimicrobiia bacterium]|nr:isoprenylcysteine carboxylmethyltransferase family protein [Acidimicrobiia bacterium]
MTDRTDPKESVKPPFGVPPPVVTLLLIVVGLVIQFASPQLVLSAGWVQLVVGLPLLAIGLVLTTRSLRLFSVEGTDERYAEPTSVIVQTAPYAWTRNPMFVGAVLMYLGVALAVNTVWILFALPALILYLHFGVIRREERFLEARFGDQFTDYKTKVPRWVPRLTAPEWKVLEERRSS